MTTKATAVDWAAFPEWLNQVQAGQLAGVCDRTIRRRIKAKAIPYFRDPATGYPRIAKADLAAYLSGPNYRPAKYSRQHVPVGVPS